MGATDDVRKVMQYVIAPYLKALDARISALDKKVDLRVDALGSRFAARIDALDKKIDLRADVLDERINALDQKLDLTRDLILSEMRSVQASLTGEMVRLQHSIEIDRRVEKLENERITAVRSPLEKRRLGLHRP